MDPAAGLRLSAPLPMPVNAPRFAEVVARERSRLGRFIRGQVRDAAEAEDILQDVLLDLRERQAQGEVDAAQALRILAQTLMRERGEA